MTPGDLSDLEKTGKMLMVAVLVWWWLRPVVLLLLTCQDPMGVRHDCKETASSLGLNIAEAIPFCGLYFT